MSEEIKNIQDFQEMSDEELMAMPLDSLPKEEVTEVDTEVEEQVGEVAEDQESEVEVGEEEVGEVDPTYSEEDTEKVTADVNRDDDPSEDAVPDTGEVREKGGSLEEYRGFYEAVTSPIKANGKDIVVNDIEDIRRLVSMGIGFSKKNEEFKSAKSIVKTLEKNNIDESKLNLLIDLNNKDPAAIAKFLKDSEVDLDYFDTSQGDGYTPKENVVTLTPFDEVIEEFKGSDAFNEVLGQVDTWDDKSKHILVENPEILRLMKRSKDSGLFNEVVNGIEEAKLLGRIPEGMPIVHAYQSIEANILNAANHNTQDKSFTGTRPVNKNSTNDARKKAGNLASANTKVTANVKSQADLAKMSDEELNAYMAKFVN